MNASPRADWRTPTAVLVCGGMILTLSLGLRHGFGLFLQPMTADLHWGRETFAFALAVQNLVWGASQPFAGMFADKYGGGRVAGGGALLYLAGLALMAYPVAPWFFVLSSGVLVGLGLSGVSFSVIQGIVGRRYPPEKRSMALGISAAAGSFGQFALLPLTQWLITHVGWHGALLTLAAVGLLMIPLALGMVEKGARHATHAFKQSAGQAMREALGHRGYVLLTIGFFVCGFQLVFVGVHLPAYLADRGFPPNAAVIALALIGLFNIFGTYTTGWLGGRMPKRWILSAIYLGRAAAIALFLWLPMSFATIYLFAMAFGFLWLSTVPPTNGIVAGVFGTRYLAMLSGFSFFSHQIGSFLGAWLGGYLFDRTGSYDVVWWIAIALGVLAGLINLPIDERQIRRTQPAESAA
ncbi:MAG TPA: MFS transporter [Casimicrobiaceae bacterium]|nr:MFS transporter [Casimicrobiaceae bacterium]